MIKKMKDEVRSLVTTGIIMTCLIGFFGYVRLADATNELKRKIDKWRSEG